MAKEIIKSKPITSMKDAYSVEGKNVVVTGGNRGIGRGIVQAFAESGCNVVIMCRNLESGEKAAAELEQYGGTYGAVQCDISDYESVKAAKEKVFEIIDHIDVLVNDAGVATNPPFLSETGLDEWHRVVDTNLHGTASVVYELVPSMVEHGTGGLIINISSIGAIRCPVHDDQHNAPYNASKAGIDMFSTYLAIALGGDNIRCVSIQPGPVHSDLDKQLSDVAKAGIETMMPMHRFGEPIEVGAFCVYLASPAAAFITGVHVPFDGGMSVVG